MNSFSEAVKLAIKEGYLKSPYYHPTVHSWGVVRKGDDSDTEKLTNAEIVLDPLFWQALGKALGWTEYTTEYHGNWDDMRTMQPEHMLTWKYHAHRFLDIKLSGGNEEQFFNELLKGKV